jgi:hypothetical protein
VSARQLILEHRADEAIVEKSRGAIDDVERLGLGIVSLDAAGRTKHSAVRQGRSARLAGLPLWPPAEEVANRHSVKPISHVIQRPASRRRG